MTNLVTNTDFTGRYLIANQTTAEVAALLNDMVTVYQPVFLRQLLGAKLYKDFQDWLNLAVDARPVNATWTALLTGIIFTDKYSVSRYSEPVKTALISYVYNLWQRGNVSQTSGVGEVIIDAQNASAASPQQKLIDRWNEMCENARNNYAYLDKALETNADWRAWSRYCCGFSYWAEDVYKYPDTEIFNNINQFGL